MIFDTIENSSQYAQINPGINKILELARSYNSENFPKDRILIDGEALFMNFADYKTHSEIGALSEAHRKYIDVMYMVEGCETIYVKNTDDLKEVTREYDESIEALLAKIDDDTTAVRLNAGSFVILFPQDAHAPCRKNESSDFANKLVFKIKL